MAVVTVKSTQITNRDATPRVLSNSRVVRGDVHHARGVCAIANGDSIASKYLFCSIPSNAIPVSVRVTSPDIGTTTAGDIGLYKTTADGGAVADVDFFASALSLSGGALAKSDVTNENSAVATPANGEKTVWELLGLSADSGLMYDVVLTLTAAADAAGSVLVEIDYVA
jgi:hypothetical protein